MKTKFFYLFLAALTAVVLTSCEENAGGKASSMKFKRMDIAGAKAIALAADGSSQHNAPARAKLDGDEDPTYNVSNPIYTVSEDGTLVEVHYTIEVVGNGEIVDLIKANMRLKARYIYAIGDEWLWLVNCEYDYPGIEDVQEPLRGRIRELMHAAFESNYLVRRSDGALFEWSREQGRPERGMGYWRPSDVYGEVEAVGKDIFTSPCMSGVDDYYGKIYKLQDQGDELNVVQVLSSSQQGGWLLPDNRGFIGTYLFSAGDLPVILNPQTLQLSNISTGDIDVDQKETKVYGRGFVSIGGTTYLCVENANEYGTTTKCGLYNLEEKNGMWTAQTPALIEWNPGDGYSAPSTGRPYKGAVATWMANGYSYALDPINKTFTRKALPAHYPSEEDQYYDGIAYVMAENNDGFYVCDLSKTEAEFVEAVWDESMIPYISQIAMVYPFGAYDPNTQCFTGGAQLLDGTYLVFILDTQGANRGKVRVLKAGESDAGTVISVMVRLN